MCLKPGDILRDRYQIIAQLGEGGFGKTYTANDALGRQGNALCVVKEIPSPQSNDPEVLHATQVQFEREVRSLKYLDMCLRIPRLIDSFQKPGKFYLIQEYIEGNPLNKELGGGRQFKESEVIDLLQDILSVLDCVHSQNIIHRDLKPSNLIRCKRTSKIAVIDFGAVKAIGTLASECGKITQTRIIGTEGYMPAEQLHGQPKFNSDIYAVGIIGIQAIAGLEIEDLLYHKKTGELIWHYSTHDRRMVQISDNLKKVLDKMVRYHFKDRYQSAVEVLQDLREAKLSRRESLTVWHSPPPKRQRLSGPSVKWLQLALAGVMAGGAIAIYYSIFSSKTNLVLGDGLSAGDKILVTSSSPRLKQRGVEQFAASKFQEAFNLFKESWNQEDGKDPETLIYMNNAFLEARNAPYYTIALVVPIRRRNPNNFGILAEPSKEILRGVAQAQTEVNLGLLDSRSDGEFPGLGFLPSKLINGKGLKVVIADDANDRSEAQQRAKFLVKQPNILAVIGHTNSDITMYVVDIYNRNNLVLMSPSSATEELTEDPRKYFFRTTYTSKLMAKTLAELLLEKGQKKAAVFYSASSPLGASFWQEFNKYFQGIRGGKIAKIRDFDLSKTDFNAQRAIKEIEANGETAIALVPDGQVMSSLNSAFEMIKLNRGRNWMTGTWTLVQQQTLEVVAHEKSFNKLILSVGWHSLSSPNKEFPQQALSLWGREVNTRTALAYDAARAIVKALEMQQQPSREGMQKMLSSPDFSADGATGTIQFESPKNGNRKNPPSDLVHIVECKKEQFGVVFVPVKYPTAEAAGLKCDRSLF